MSVILKYQSGTCQDWTYESAERVAEVLISIKDIPYLDSNDIDGWRDYEAAIESRIIKHFNMGLPVNWMSPLSYIQKAGKMTVFRIWNKDEEHYTVVEGSAFIMSENGATADKLWENRSRLFYPEETIEKPGKLKPEDAERSMNDIMREPLDE